MLGILFRKMSLWWRFRQLDKTYQPLLEKAMAFDNREALLKLEEQYWYQTACLLEERREIRKARGRRTQHSSMQVHSTNGNPVHKNHTEPINYSYERDLTYRDRNTAWPFLR